MSVVLYLELARALPVQDQPTQCLQTTSQHEGEADCSSVADYLPSMNEQDPHSILSTRQEESTLGTLNLQNILAQPHLLK